MNSKSAIALKSAFGDLTSSILGVFAIAVLRLTGKGSGTYFSGEIPGCTEDIDLETAAINR